MLGAAPNVNRALRHQAWMAASQACGLVSLPPSPTVEQQAQAVVCLGNGRDTSYRAVGSEGVLRPSRWSGIVLPLAADRACATDNGARWLS
jgi:hypothetical protein